jgi:hypothetical protein
MKFGFYGLPIVAFLALIIGPFLGRAMGKFNSSDLYGALKEGCTDNADVVGQRNGWRNWHRNIITAASVSCRPKP